MRHYALSFVAMALFSACPVPALADETNDIAGLVRQYEADADIIRKKADLELRQLRERLIERLTARMDEYMKAGKLDQAVIFRDQIRALSEGQSIKVQAYPGSMTQYRSQIGAVLYFEITGS